MIRNPNEGVICVGNRSGKLVLWRETIIHRQDDTMGDICNRTAHRIVRFEAAKYPAAAMVKDKGGIGCTQVCGSIHTDS
ncbi:hypothetical protein GCM10025858_19360 [Alicyclobacillus sacchari]|nr:hypothetical protein GCM10025858_19360 [Alicyclobacillus sacchari]